MSQSDLGNDGLATLSMSEEVLASSKVHPVSPTEFPAHQASGGSSRKQISHVRRLTPSLWEDLYLSRVRLLFLRLFLSHLSSYSYFCVSPRSILDRAYDQANNPLIYTAAIPSHSQIRHSRRISSHVPYTTRGYPVSALDAVHLSLDSHQRRWQTVRLTLSQDVLVSLPNREMLHSTAKSPPSMTMLDRYLEDDLQGMERLALEGSSSAPKANKKVMRKKTKKYLKDWDKTWEKSGNAGSK